MQNRITTILGALAGALVLALILGIVGLLATRPALAAVTTGGTPRQVTVIGEGEVKGTPDVATVQIGVETDGQSAQEALAQNTAQVAAIMAKLKELGIGEQDIQTSNFNISPTYNSDGRQVTGYRVSNSVSVTIRQLDSAGALLDQVVQLGANSIYGISFSVNDPSALLDQARDKAMVAAKAKAEQLAKAGGATVGQVLVITENVGATQPIVMERALMQDAAASVPVQPGQQSYSLQVQVTFELR